MVQTANTEIEAVAAQVNEASVQIGELADRVGEIGSIASVIKEIADQTNLLALNAAIEAARAGEQGRGFAVVADEVRKLAERTTQATEEISSKIEAIYRESSEAVDSMKGVAPQVALGRDAVNNAGGALEHIREASVVTLNSISDISNATVEQSKASSSVAISTEKISAMLENAANSVRKVNENVTALKHLSSDLSETVSHFVIK